MKKILMRIDVIDRHYCIYIDADTNIVNALAVKKNFETYLVTKEKEIAFLNDIIKENLSKKYFKQDEIEFEGKSYIRYLNRYDQKNYFATLDEDKLRVIPYGENPKLYDLYNPTKIIVCDMKSGGLGDIGKGTVGKLKIAAATAVGIAMITITGCGKSELANSEVPAVTATEQENIIAVETIKKEEAEDFIEVEALKGYQITPENQSQEELKEKYDTVKTKLEEIGLENWEIAIELDDLKNFNAIFSEENTDEINFYYDSENDRVIYIYEAYDRDTVTYQNSNEKNNSSYQEIPENVQILIDTINSNSNLSEEERKFIIDTSIDDWIENSEYLQTNILKIKYRDLKINYNDSDLHVDLPNSPYQEAAGWYSHELLPGEEFFEEYGTDIWQDTESSIIIGNVNSFEETDEKVLKVLRHEIGHIRGDFGNGNCLLNEGYNSWNTGDDTYKNEQAMAMIMISIFGKDVVNEGYYTFSLANAISNEIAEKTGKDSNEAYQEASDLLSSIQSVLYKTAENSLKNSDENQYRNDENIMSQYKEIMEKISDIYKEITGKSITENNVAQVIMDYILGTNNSKLLTSDKEKISEIQLSKDGTLNITIESDNGRIKYENFNGSILDGGGKYYRSVSIKLRGTY